MKTERVSQAEQDIIYQANIRVTEVLQDNRISDLDRILKKRECLDTTNTVFQYLFFIFQATGIFLVSISNAMNIQDLVWVGVFCNAVAGIFNAGYTLNQKQSAKMLKDLQNIKKNKYIDQGVGEIKQGSRDPNNSYNLEDDQQFGMLAKRSQKPTTVVQRRDSFNNQHPFFAPTLPNSNRAQQDQDNQYKSPRTSLEFDNPFQQPATACEPRQLSAITLEAAANQHIQEPALADPNQAAQNDERV